MASQIIKELTSVKKTSKVIIEQPWHGQKGYRPKEQRKLATIQETKKFDMIKISKHTNSKQKMRPFRH